MQLRKKRWWKKTWNSSELACALLCLLIVRKSNSIFFEADMHSVVSLVWSVRICLVYMGKNSSRQIRSFVVCIFEKRHTNAEKCSNVCRRLCHDETDSLISHPFGTSYTLRMHTHTSAHKHSAVQFGRSISPLHNYAQSHLHTYASMRTYSHVCKRIHAFQSVKWYVCRWVQVYCLIIIVNETTVL